MMLDNFLIFLNFLLKDPQSIISDNFQWKIATEILQCFLVAALFAISTERQ